jgi:uncharacterized integral membrane protein (TIGR00698 family)
VSKPDQGSRLGPPVSIALSLVPGLAVAVVLAYVSMLLANVVGVTILGFDKTPVSPVMLAIFLGLIVRAVLPMPEILKPGVSFAVKWVLRLGIVLLGVRLSIFDVFTLGIRGLPIVFVCVVAGLLATTRISRLLKIPERLGTLIAVGTSICGVSAILATAPAIEAEEDEVAYAVAVIAVFGLLATLVYPSVARLVFGGNMVNVGLFLGTSVQDTSQVVGAAKVYSDLFSAPRVLDIATVTKLVRNVFMVAVIPLMSFLHSRGVQGQVPRGKAGIAKLLPLFVLGFLLMAAVRSVGDAGINARGLAFGLWDVATWTHALDFMKSWSENLLVVALAGVGLSTDFRSFRGLGVKPFIVGLGAALSVGLVSFAAISLMGSLVNS